MNFYIPNRQAPIGIIVNFIYWLQKFVRAFFPVLILVALRINKGEWTGRWDWILLSVIVGLILALVFAYFSYRNFTFHIEKETDAFVFCRREFLIKQKRPFNSERFNR